MLHSKSVPFLSPHDLLSISTWFAMRHASFPHLTYSCSSSSQFLGNSIQLKLTLKALMAPDGSIKYKCSDKNTNIPPSN